MAQLAPIPLHTGDVKHWGNIAGSLLTREIASTALQHSGLSVVICQNSAEAQRLQEDLAFFCAQLPRLSLPDWETLPYDYFSPHQDIISERLATLASLPSIRHGILVIPASALQQRLAPASYILGQSFTLKKGDRLDPEQLRQRLVKAGYHVVDTVYEHGECAMRGAIVDIFPMGSEQPFRIDLFDDEIDTIRWFDPESQRSTELADEINLLPAREFPLDAAGISLFKKRWFDFFESDPKECPLYLDIVQGIAPGGIEYYLPLFFAETSTLFDYLPDNTLIFHPSALESDIALTWQEVSQRYEERRHDRRHPVLKPADLFLRDNEIYAGLGKCRCVRYGKEILAESSAKYNFTYPQLPDLSIDHKLVNPLQRLEDFLKTNSHPVLFCVESNGRREALFDLLKRSQIKVPTLSDFDSFINSEDQLAICISPLQNSFYDQNTQSWLITEDSLFGQRIQQKRRREKQKEAQDHIRDLSELSIGSPVVHLDHGIGKYLGLQTLQIDQDTQEFLTLEYAGSAKLYVPVASLHLISRYSGADADQVQPHKLGTDKWSSQKRKALEKIRDTAAELLEIYAKREAKQGFGFDIPEQEYASFAAAFPFEETPDQESAIAGVLNDMAKKRPMDRLVCGDVGFGKTEVALRAAFVAAQAGKQVAVLVPTTLLAQQHYDNFRDRFADWPIRVDVISRFKTGENQNKALQGLEDGTTDIIIGTHKLLQPDIKFKNLGLLIIDEEHRFGVQQKERVKALRAEVDILTMTATPIPRTLNMAMSGIRDLSIIATPPAKRLAVKTFVHSYDERLIKEAVLREILRGGQVFFLHNEVKDIEKVAQDLTSLVPEARVGIAHGQMSERQLEQVMGDFYHKRFNVLLCTTIIETGIDVPSANTIIINRADKFGLAQLHQLRGRVGRSHHQAYAYLLTPNEKQLTKDAEKRLEAISAAQDLGAGFMLATHDLEIRGAGELLGEEQSGHIQNIGFTLYMDLLDKAVKAIKEGKTLNLDDPFTQACEVNLRIPALIPDDYLPDVHNRLIMYKRIAHAQNSEELRELQVEMIDRFGLLPVPIKNLFRQTELKFRLIPMGIKKLDAGDKQGSIEFASSTTVDPFTLVRLVQSMPNTFKLSGSNSIKFNIDMPDAESRFAAIDDTLNLLSKSPEQKTRK